MCVTQEKLKSVLSYDETTGIFRWKGTRSGVSGVNNIAGCLHVTGYVHITVFGKEYKAHRLAWLYVYGNWPSLQIDHIDENKSNNAISNLREVTNGENCCRRGPQKNNTSGVKGVSGKPGKWRVRVGPPGEGRKHLGYYSTLEEAEKVASEARKIFHKEFCNNENRR